MPRSAFAPVRLLHSGSAGDATAEAKPPLPELPRVITSTDPRGSRLPDQDDRLRSCDEPDEGKAAVAHVVLNRERSGRWGESIREVVTRPWQFEPWMTGASRWRLSPSDPRYRDAARIADAVLSGEFPDPTAGATHFLNPTIVRKRRGGSLPEWARGEGQPIGQHTFYAPNGGVPAIDQTEMPVDAADVSLFVLWPGSKESPG